MRDDQVYVNGAKKRPNFAQNLMHFSKVALNLSKSSWLWRYCLLKIVPCTRHLADQNSEIGRPMCISNKPYYAIVTENILFGLSEFV